MEKKVRKELALYKLREIEILDMKLKIEELKVGEQLGAMGFEERVQTSINCKNNDYVMNQIESLEKKIELYELANQRVDNALSALSDVERQVVKMVIIDKSSIAEATKKLFRSRRQIYYILDQAISKLSIA